LSFVVSFAVITLLFAMIFRYLPDAKVSWEDVWVGSAATALLFTVGKTLIGLYLGKSSVASAYGAAGSLVVVLLWVYYSSQILFLGAELTQVYAKRYGQEIAPDRHAVRVKQVKVSEEEPGFEKVEKVAKKKEVSRKVEAGSPVSPQAARSSQSEESPRTGEKPRREEAPAPVLRDSAVVLLLVLFLRHVGKRVLQKPSELLPEKR
jgi:membrane protein